MIAMRDAGAVYGSYGVVLAGIVAYVAWLLHKSRKMAAQLPDEDKPWT